MSQETNFGRRREDMDSMIDSVQAGVMSLSTAEILWGGPRGDGLVHTVARLAQSVDTLGQTVTTLAAEVGGADGLQAGLAKTNDKVDRLYEMVKWGGGIVSAMLIVALIWLIGRSVQIAITGHL